MEGVFGAVKKEHAAKKKDPDNVTGQAGGAPPAGAQPTRAEPILHSRKHDGGISADRGNGAGPEGGNQQSSLQLR